MHYTNGGLGTLAGMEYPGRVIVIGRLPDETGAVAYAITGRSPASRARRLAVGEDGHVYTRPTDEETLRRGNPALLVYPALMLAPIGIAVSNGAQTPLVYEELLKGDTSAAEVLRRALAAPRLVAGIDVTSYEPDEPNFTPRISGCITATSAALAIARRGPRGEVERQVFDLTGLAAGQGKAIATYAGPNRDPLPAWTGGPIDVALTATDAAELATALYTALGPRAGGDDRRVAAAAVALTPSGPGLATILNRVELGL